VGKFGNILITHMCKCPVQRLGTSRSHPSDVAVFADNDDMAILEQDSGNKSLCQIVVERAVPLGQNRYFN